MEATARLVSAIEPRAIPGVIGALVRAFEDDPVFEYLYPNLDRRRRAVGWLHTVAIRGALQHGGRVTVTGESAGACIWYPEGAYPPPALSFLSLAAGLWHLPPTSIPRSIATLRRIQSLHPRDIPHIYVEVLGVDPRSQRGGHGSALLKHLCGEADHAGIAVYLETTKPENVNYYGRFGFGIVGEGDFKRGPHYWLLLRPETSNDGRKSQALL